MSPIARSIVISLLMVLYLAMQGCGKTEERTAVGGESNAEADTKKKFVEYGDGGPGDFLNRVLYDLVNGKKEVLFDSLSEEYLASIHPEYFLQQLANYRWKLENYGFLSSTQFEGVHCFVVEYSAERLIGEKIENFMATVPVFVIDQNEQWKLWNFAFAPSVARNYPQAKLCITRK